MSPEELSTVDHLVPHVPTVDGEAVFRPENLELVKAWGRNSVEAAYNWNEYKRHHAVPPDVERMYDEALSKDRPFINELSELRRGRVPVVDVVNRVVANRDMSALSKVPSALWDSAKVGFNMNPADAWTNLVTPLAAAGGIGGLGLVYKSKLFSRPRHAGQKLYKALSHHFFPVAMQRSYAVKLKKSIHDSDRAVNKIFTALSKRRKFKGSGRFTRAGAAVLNLLSPLVNKNLYKGVGRSVAGGIYSPGHGLASFFPGVQKSLVHNPGGLTGAAIGLGLTDYNLQKSFYGDTSNYFPGRSFWGSLPESERAANIGSGGLGAVTGFFLGSLPRRMAANPLALVANKLGSGVAIAGTAAAVEGGRRTLSMHTGNDMSRPDFSKDFVGAVNNLRYATEPLAFRPEVRRPGTEGLRRDVQKPSPVAVVKNMIDQRTGLSSDRIIEQGKRRANEALNSALNTPEAAPVREYVDVLRNNDAYIPSTDAARRTTFKAIDKGLEKVYSNRQRINFNKIREALGGRILDNLPDAKTVGDAVHKGMSGIHNVITRSNTQHLLNAK